MSATPTKSEDSNRDLDIRLAPSTITSQGQFLALVTSSHPRVSRSPALINAPQAVKSWLTPRLFSLWTDNSLDDDSSVTVQCLGCEKSHLIRCGSKCHALNSKWVVTCAGGAEYGFSLTVWRLVVTSGMEIGVVEPVVVPLSGWEPWCRMELDFNQVNQDEVIWTTISWPTVVRTLIDVDASYHSRRAVVLSSTASERRYSFYDPIILRRKDGAPVFLVRPSENDYDVLALDPTTSTSKVVTNNCGCLTQVSSSVFCVWCWENRSFGLWDFNNLDQPLRVMTRPGVYRKVVGGSGFLFALRDFSEVVVMEAHSQVAVMSFQFVPSQSGLRIDDSSLLF
ncbi:hypothetical protein Pelo_19160 [Pelomyxa schiedti]|nr:hypothetical protein Pelo_19160 [Pelomyxa schiedti]